MFRVYNEKDEPLGGEQFVRTFPTQEEAVSVARSLIGFHDSLYVRDVQTGRVVWELKDARSAPVAAKV